MEQQIREQYNQFLRLRRLCSDDDDFLTRSREMLTFFSLRGYPCSSLENDLRRVATINRPDAVRSSEENDGTVDRLPLVLTYHPFNTQIKWFLLQNFCILLSTAQQTQDIFPQPPFVAYKRDLNLRNMLVHSNDHSSTEQHGSRACQRPRVHTCQYISPDTEIRGPNYSFSVRGHFTCQSSNLVHCKSCNRCPTILYIGETGRSFRSRFSEHLRSICNSTPGSPVAQHFNSTGHSISDIQVRGMQLCNGTNLQGK